MSASKIKFCELPVEEYISDLSSRAPIPGGCGTSALVGALGIALGGMVANMSLGKNQYTETDGDIASLKVSAYRVQKELLELVEKEAEVFAPLAGTYRMPTDTEEERESRERVKQAFLKDSALVPLEMMRKCGEAIMLLKQFAIKGSVYSLSDAGCGAILCKAAMQSAWLNVSVNTKHIKDKKFVSDTNNEAREILEQYLPLADKIYKYVDQKLI